MKAGRKRVRTNLWVYLGLAGGVLILGSAAIFVRLALASGVVTSFYRTAIAAILLVFPFTLSQLSEQRRSRKTIRGPHAQVNSTGTQQNPNPASWAGHADLDKPGEVAEHEDSANAAVPQDGNPGERRQRIGLKSAGIAAAGGALFAADLALWSSGIVMGGATNPTLMANTAPLWVGLGSMVFFHERRGRSFWTGLWLAMAGVMVVLGQELALAMEFGLGSILGLLAAIFYGAYFLVTQAGRARLDTVRYSWISTTSSALVLLLMVFLFDQPLTGYTSLTWLAFLASGLIVQTGGWLLLNYVQGVLPASIVSPTMLLQPVITAFIAIPLFGEQFTAWHVLGGSAVLAGIFMVHRSRFANPVES